MSLPKKARIRELGPREGFQTLSQTVATEHKLNLIAALGKTGVKEIELTSFVRPDRVPQMADAEEVVSKFERVEGVRYSALYLNTHGLERAVASKRLDVEGWLYLAASESFLRKNNNCGIEDLLGQFPAWLTQFKHHKVRLQGLMLSCAFGCNYEGVVAPHKVQDLIGRVVELCRANGTELNEICLADTVGRGNPNSVRTLIELVRKRHPKMFISLHLHDTRGTGMANVYAGLLEGIDCFDASVGGLGGCPFAKGSAGNVCSEDVAYLFAELGIESGLNLAAYAEAAELAEKIVGHELPGRYYKSVRRI